MLRAERRATVCNQMENADKEQRMYEGSTIGAIVLVLIVYPMTIAPVGTLSNGGALGLLTLAIALVLSWRAFLFNRAQRLLRLLVQLPLSAITSYLAIADAYNQYSSGQLLWF